MELHLLRNATMRITMAGQTILTDPVLSPRHGIESFAGNEKNPTVDLPVPVEEIINGVDMILVSHLHQDHFDASAKELLPKDTPLFCQPGDKDTIAEAGFSDIRQIDDSLRFDTITLKRTKGKHASSKKWNDLLGKVSGFVFSAPNEPTLYWAGDTVFNDEVKATIDSVHPDIILTHSCGAVLDDSGPIVMDDQQTIDVCKVAPNSKVIAIHMEALDHGTISRKMLRQFADSNGISETQLLIPDDGEKLVF
jgi:L-ascorbate metabolism protein UlaG (beta-lactamase superfamily)